MADTNRVADYNDVITPEVQAEIDAQVPSNLSMSEQFRIRNRLINEYMENYQKNADAGQGKSDDAETADSDGGSVSEELSEQEDSNKPDLSEQKSELKSKLPADKSASKQAKHRGKAKSSLKNVAVRDIPENVVLAIRQCFPQKSTNGDLIAAAGYIFTNGNCKISPEAMELVKAYQGDKETLAYAERIANMERLLYTVLKMLQSIELCTCYNTYDRRYGSKERRKNPGETEFREQGNLDMLYRLRIQAEDQRKLDNEERGRAIYNQIKDLDDDKY